MTRRVAILLGRGSHVDEVNSLSELQDIPKADFVEIAKCLNADVHSFTSSASQRGHWFRTLFSKRPEVGSAFSLAMDAGKYDVVLATSEDLAKRFAIFCFLFGRKTKICTIVHNFRPIKLGILDQICMTRISKFITLCGDQSEKLYREGIHEDRVCEIFDGVDDAFFLPDPIKTAGGNGDVVACGAEHRDYDLIVRAAKRSRRTFRIFGSGTWGATMSSLGDACPENVKVMPRVTFPELLAFMRDASLIVVPVRPCDYAAGVNGLMEGLVLGKPVVATDAPSLAKYLEEVPREFRIPYGDDAKLSAALEAFDSDRTRYEAQFLGKIREWALNNFSQRNYVSAVSGIVSNC